MVSKRKQSVLLFSPDRLSESWQDFYDLETTITKDLCDRSDPGGSVEELPPVPDERKTWPFPKYKFVNGEYVIIKPKKDPLPEALF